MDKIEEIRLAVPWGFVAAKAWGVPIDFPVLCVHGILDNAGAFDRLIAQLPKNYYYVSIDLPGHGFSSHFPAGVPLDFFNYVLTIRYVVEGLKWKTFYFVGHSLGGQLGTFYSIIYPGKIQKMILVEGLSPVVIPKNEIVDRIRKTHTESIEAHNKEKQKLYSYDEIIHTLRFKRSVCLNSDAAQALFKRSVSDVADKYKYNRDYRLKSYVIPFFTRNQLAYIFSKLNVKTLFFLTRGTMESLGDSTKIVEHFIENLQNLKMIIVDGNHDVHNNHPERISFDICKFLNEQNILSKL